MGIRVALRIARNPWLSVLLLATFFTRAFIPVGYMPGPGGLMLCPGDAATATSTAMGHAAQDHMPGMDMADRSTPMDQGGKAPSHDGMAMCPFAAAATAIALLHAPTVATFAAIVPFEIKARPEPFIPRTTVSLSRLPRGPPALV